MVKSHPQKKDPPPAKLPHLHTVDAVAAFVETAEDLSREPFMAKDENRKFSLGPDNQHTFTLGDRSHFRSALISFRRLTMQKEACCYKNISNLLFLHHAPSRPFSHVFRDDVDAAMAEPSWLTPELNNAQLIDLWINTVFAHSGLKPRKMISRQFFEELVEKYGLGKMEFSFRNAVFRCSLCLLNLSRHAARPALDDWSTQGLHPSFSVSSPFGRKMRERLQDGTVIIRQASSKYYVDEALDRRFLRILKRQNFLGLSFIFENLDATVTGKCLLALKTDSVREILSQLDYAIEELPEDFGKMLAASTNHLEHIPKLKALSYVETKHDLKIDWEPIFFERDYTFRASKSSFVTLNQQLIEFIQEFKNED